MRLNWLRFALGALSISLLVIFVPMLLAVVSMTGLSAVTVTSSRTPARFNVRFNVISWPTLKTRPLRVIGSKP